MKRVLVTGASGFIGRNLVPYLACQGYSVLALSRSPQLFSLPSTINLHWPKSDVEWLGLLRDVDAIVHLAGVAHRKATAADYEDANLKMAELVTFARQLGLEQFIFVSSVAAQSDAVSLNPLSEDDEPRPASLYGKAKLAAEMSLKESGIPFTILRPVAIWGPGAKGNPRLLQMLAKQPFPLPLADLKARRSIVSIENFDSAIKAVLFNKAAIGQTFIVSDPHAKTVGEIVSEMRSLAGRRPGIVYCPARVLKWIFFIAGSAKMWDRMDGPLIAEPTKLLSIGWIPEG